MGLLRLLLALSVMTGHADKSVFGFRGLYGNIAVQCFFIISGFYMALVLNEKYIGPRSYLAFIQQRFLRIYPIYYVILLFFLIIEGLFSYGKPCGTLVTFYEYGHLLSSFGVGLVAAINLLIFGQDYSTFFSLDPNSGHFSFLSANSLAVPAWKFLLDPPVWSVGIELTFYLLAPFVVRRSFSVQAVLFFLVAAARTWIYLSVPNSRPWLYYFAPLQLNFFMAGSIGYMFYRNQKRRLDALSLSRFWIICFFLSVVVFYNRLPLAHHLYPYFIGLSCFMVPILFSATRNNSLDRTVGELSYPFYLIHYHVILLLNDFYPALPIIWFGPMCAGITLCLAYLCFKYIETYTERFRERLYRRRACGMS